MNLENGLQEEFRPGIEYTDYIVRRTGLDSIEDSYYFDGESWYEIKTFNVSEGITDKNTPEDVVSHVNRNFSNDAVIREVRVEDGNEATIRILEPTEEYEVDMKPVGTIEDLKETIKEHEESLPGPPTTEGGHVGYLDLEEQLRNIEVSLNEPGDSVGVFYLFPEGREGTEFINDLYNTEMEIESEDDIPEIDIQLQQRSFLMKTDRVCEVE